MNYSEEIEERKKINKILVRELADLVVKHPTQRFGQILLNHFFSKYDSLEGMDLRSTIYNEEPSVTLGNLNVD